MIIKTILVIVFIAIVFVIGLCLWVMCKCASFGTQLEEQREIEKKLRKRK